LLKLLILILASVVFGFSIKLHAQSRNSMADPVVVFKLSALEENVKQISRKTDDLESKVATVEGAGAGISSAIVLLQLLGLVTRKKLSD